MAPGNFSNALGKRPVANPQLGRPGTGEENLRAYTGVRIGEARYTTGTNVTATGVCAGAVIGTPGPLPRNLTRVVDASGAQRTRLPLPIALIAQLNAAAAPAGVHTATFRVLGESILGEPILEDITLSANAGGSSAVTPMLKPFHRIFAVQIIAENNTAAGDTLGLDFQIAVNARLGLPVRVRDVADVLSVVLVTDIGAAITIADLGQNAGTGFTVDVANQAILPFIGGGFSDAVALEFQIRCRTSLGMDQGFTRPVGEKLIKNRG